MILRYNDFINEIAHHYEKLPCEQLKLFLEEDGIKEAIVEDRVFASFRSEIYDSRINPINQFHTPTAYYTYPLIYLLRLNDLDIDDFNLNVCNNEEFLKAPYKPKNTKYLQILVLKNLDNIILPEDTFEGKIKHYFILIMNYILNEYLDENDILNKNGKFYKYFNLNGKINVENISDIKNLIETKSYFNNLHNELIKFSNPHDTHTDAAKLYNILYLITYINKYDNLSKKLKDQIIHKYTYDITKIMNEIKLYGFKSNTDSPYIYSAEPEQAFFIRLNNIIEKDKLGHNKEIIIDISKSNNLGDSILKYIKKGNIKALKNILDKDSSILNKNIQNGATPLIHAVVSNNKDIIWFFINNYKKYNINFNIQTDYHKETFLSWLINEKMNNIYEYLIKNHKKYNIDLELTDSNDKTILHKSLTKKDDNLTKLLIDNGAKYNIYILIYYKNIEMIKELINKKELNFKEYGKNPIFYAIDYGNDDIIKLFINNHKKINLDLNIKNNQGKSLIEILEYENKYKLIDLLIKKGKYNIKDLILINNIDKIKEMVDKGYDINKPITNNKKEEITIVEYTINKNKDNLAKELIKLGANYTIFDIISLNDMDLFKKYLENNSNELMIMDENGRIPLLTIIKYNLLDFIKYIIDNYKELKVDFNITNDNNTTPFHLAVKYSLFEICKILIDNKNKIKLNINTIDRSYLTPLDSAMDNYNENIIDLLIDNGAKTYEQLKMKKPA